MKKHLAVHFSKGFFRHVDINVMDLVPKYYLFAADANKVSVFVFLT